MTTYVNGETPIGSLETHTLSMVAIGDISSNGSFASNNGDGLLNKTFTIGASATPVPILVSDDDPYFTDDDVNGNSTYWGQAGQGQTLAADYGSSKAGAAIQAEYRIELSYTDADNTVHTYSAYAVHVGNSDWDTSSYIGFIFEGQIPPAGVEMTITAVEDTPAGDGSVDGGYVAVGVPYTDVVTCFTRGTMIDTPQGPKAIETLSEGDLIITKDHGPQPIRWVGSTQVSTEDLLANEKIRPILIRKGSLGNGHPSADLMVSPQHRVLVRSNIALRMFGTEEVLVAAKQLLQLDGIDVVTDAQGVEYFHMLFDRHEIVASNGAETESLFTGPEALKALPAEAREEIFTLFPELLDRDYAPTPARVLISGRQARKLAVRHMQNRRDLVAA